MGGSSCFVPGCVSGYNKTRRENKNAGIKNPSLFLPPKDNQLFEKWKRMIPRKDKDLSPKDVVCELHFEDNCIETDYVTKMPDGFIDKIPKRHVLKEGSVPTIFPNLPAYLSIQTIKRKAPAPRPSNSEKKPRTLDAGEDIDLVVPQQPNFFLLAEQVNDILLPNSWWTVGSTGHYIIFVKWDTNFCSERRVVICKDLSTKIFLMKVEVSLSVEGFTIEHIAELLQKVDSFKICEKACSGTSSVCSGFIEGKRGSFCSSCNKSRKFMMINAGNQKL